MTKRITKGSRALTKWRCERDLSQATLAAVIGVDFSTVYHWENGTRSPGRRHAERVAKVTDNAIVPGDWDVPQDDAAAAG